MNTSEQVDQIIPALLEARKVFKPVVRTAEGQVGTSRKYKYADLETLIDATFEPLMANGIVPVQAVNAAGNSLDSRLFHTSGQWLESSYPLISYDHPQQFGLQLSYARRYSFLALLGVAQEDNDASGPGRAEPSAKTQPRADRPPPRQEPGSDGVRKINAAQRTRFWALAKEARWPDKLSVKAWLLTMGYASSNDISVANYEDICKGLEQGPPSDLPALFARAAELQSDRPKQAS